LKKVRRKLTKPVEAFGALLVFLFVKILPFKLMRLLGAFLGTIVYHIPSQKKLILANLKVAFPDMSEKEAAKIGKTSVIGMVNIFCELIWFNGSFEKIKKYLHIPEDVQKRMDEKNANGRPTVFLPMHWGNWELSSFAFRIVNPTSPCTVITRKLKNPILEKFLMKSRRESDVYFVHDVGGVKKLVKAMKDGESAGLLVDQNTKTHQGGVFGEFFGLPVTISKTAATLAAKFNANVYVFTVRRTKTGFELYTRDLAKDPDEYESKDDLNQAFLDVMEQTVRDHPEQWIWLYNRWNYIPKNREDLKDKYPYYAELDKLEYNPE
ncbi:MAG: hypothetical protein NE330_09665, partial [Lentisphaeraceae bacterium]|nr:hypothetical protein [Lentisphaeraceae bacterium]